MGTGLRHARPMSRGPGLSSDIFTSPPVRSRLTAASYGAAVNCAQKKAASVDSQLVPDDKFCSDCPEGPERGIFAVTGKESTTFDTGN